MLRLSYRPSHRNRERYLEHFVGHEYSVGEDDSVVEVLHGVRSMRRPHVRPDDGSASAAPLMESQRGRLGIILAAKARSVFWGKGGEEGRKGERGEGGERERMKKR